MCLRGRQDGDDPLRRRTTKTATQAQRLCQVGSNIAMACTVPLSCSCLGYLLSPPMHACAATRPRDSTNSEEITVRCGSESPYMLALHGQSLASPHVTCKRHVMSTGRTPCARHNCVGEVARFQVWRSHATAKQPARHLCAPAPHAWPHYLKPHRHAPNAGMFPP